jgi:hypothetical protein
VASGEVGWPVSDFCCASGCLDADGDDAVDGPLSLDFPASVCWVSAGGIEVDWRVSWVSPACGCGGTGVLGVGVLLQAANHTPAEKVDIMIKILILFARIFWNRIDVGFCQSEVISMPNIRFCKLGVKPGIQLAGDTME